MLFYDSGFQPVLYQLFCIPLCGFSVYFVVFRKEIGKGFGIEICSFHMLPKAGCRRVQADDIANINFEGFVDDVAFEGGKGENFDLTIGSGQFIPGFEDQLLGKNVGDDVEVKVTFPDEYHAEDLAGKDAVFKVKINSLKVKELPEADDDFAMDVSEFDTLDEYKADIKAKLEIGRAHV